MGMAECLTPGKRVLIIHPEGNSYNNPSLKCIIDLLKENKVWIDIRYRNSAAPMPKLQGVGLIPYGRLVTYTKILCVKFLSSMPLVFAYVLLEKILIYKKYDLIIGVDREGLIEASVLSNIADTPYVFVSFEIMFESETSVRFKRIERWASKNVSLWIVQDEIRAQCLCEENLLAPARSFLLPLASQGEGSPSAWRLRDQLGIPVEKKVAIIIGSISTWSMTSILLDSLACWPDEWVLIIHDRYGRTSKILADRIDSRSDLLHKKLFISDSATKMIDEMGYVLAGVAVGLAFYAPDNASPYTGNNLRFLGLASGKISTYLRYGVPIICNQIGLFAEQARKYQFGLVVDHPDDLVNSFAQIDTERFKINARRYFAEKLDFKLFRNLLWEEICAVLSSK